MKCPECVEAGQKSRVHVGVTSTTCMGTSSYYDEEGVYHYHDPNTRGTSFGCSSGHRWNETTRPKCPGCGKEGL